MAIKKMTGRVAAEGLRDHPGQIDAGLMERLRRLDDLSSLVSDVLDEFGLEGTVSASVLKGTLDATVVGTAVTLRNVPQSVNAHVNVSQRDWKMAEIEGINQAEPGQVLVIQGLAGVSNMGGLMASIAKHQGLAAAVVDGGVRDIGHSRSIAFPVWSRDVTPLTGKWRCTTVEVNGAIQIQDCQVEAGDLVVADETGICFVPRAWVERVVTRCEEIAAYEDRIARLTECSATTMQDFLDALYSKA
ncbi:RraA family protein [Bordetella trematum]|uniref:RraA family protein n=1 Tax=Bordetella trematum TaxID=123899 RepID=UPI000D81D494|nr:RraA family protein [Bordetella trematum]SPU48667.1 dimethylmenaquinone methyltransferase [Bordetella trematum]VDH05037.1 4-hydroxy-2-oxoglutarate aldolase [Bordetella trematum]